MIDSEHLEKVCKIGKQDCCKYILMGSGFVCAKDTGDSTRIHALSQAEHFRAKNDNCEGYSQFQNVKNQIK